LPAKQLREIFNSPVLENKKEVPVVPTVVPTPEVKPAPVKLTPNEVGQARAEGHRLYKLAGRPTRDQVIAVYGTAKAISWTWERRAKAAGYASAEEAASQFQSLLAAK
jgi:hypothetical protein